MAHQTQVQSTPAHAAEEPTVGALVHRISEEVPELVRSEVKLAQAEVMEKGRAVGTGLGMFSAAGLLAFFAVGSLVTTAILALDLVLPAWAASLVVAALLLALAGVVALVGRRKVADGQPLKPERALTGVQQDVAAVKEAVR
jgi:uncharacterized membrane protein YqjE